MFGIEYNTIRLTGAVWFAEKVGDVNYVRRKLGDRILVVEDESRRTGKIRSVGWLLLEIIERPEWPE